MSNMPEEQMSLFSWVPESLEEITSTKNDVELSPKDHGFEPIAQSLSEHPIHCRKNVFYCIQVQSDYKDGLFHHECKITGQTWETEPWRQYRDYEKDPIITPCDSCLFARCEWCTWRRGKPCTWEACGSCAHMDVCEERARKSIERL